MPDRRAARRRSCANAAKAWPTKEKFFTDNADRIVECCTAMAQAFDAGGRLFVMGNGG